MSRKNRVRGGDKKFVAYIIDINTDIEGLFDKKPFEGDSYEQIIYSIEFDLSRACRFSGEIDEEGKYALWEANVFESSVISRQVRADNEDESDQLRLSLWFPSPWEQAVNQGSLIAATTGNSNIIFYKFCEFKERGYIVKCEIDENLRSSDYHSSKYFTKRRDFAAPFSSVAIIHAFAIRDECNWLFIDGGNFQG